MTGWKCLAALILIGPTAWAGEKLEYNKDIRPILAENCFACHGPDKNARKSDLRLDVREDAVRAKAIVPGDPDRSGLVARIFESDPARIMPSRKSLKKLTDRQKEILKKWVLEGGEYQPHWSFIAPKRPSLPRVKNQEWARNAIDHFILAELEKQGITPAREADRQA